MTAKGGMLAEEHDTTPPLPCRGSHLRLWSGNPSPREARPGSPRQAPPADCHRPAMLWRVASQKKPLLRSTPGHGRSSASSSL